MSAADERRIGKSIALARELMTFEIDALRKRKGRMTIEADEDLSYARCISDLLRRGAITMLWIDYDASAFTKWKAIACSLNAKLKEHRDYSDCGEVCPLAMLVTMPDHREAPKGGRV